MQSHSQLFSFSIFSLFQLHLNILKLQIENPYYMECHGMALDTYVLTKPFTAAEAGGSEHGV